MSRLALALQARAPLSVCFTEMAVDAVDPTTRSVCEGLTSDLEAGWSLAEAAALYPTFFSTLHLGWLTIAENTGRTEEALEGLLHCEAMWRLPYLRVRTTSMYVLVFFSLCLAAGGLLWLLPLLWGSAWWANRRFKRMMADRAGQLQLSRWALKTPRLQDQFRTLMVAQLCRAMAMQLKGGVPLLAALPMAGKASGCRLLEGLADQATEQLVAERTLAFSLGETGIFTGDTLSYVRCGEETGTLAELLTSLAERTESEALESSRDLTCFVKSLCLMGITVLFAMMMLGTIPVYVSRLNAVRSLKWYTPVVTKLPRPLAPARPAAKPAKPAKPKPSKRGKPR